MKKTTLRKLGIGIGIFSAGLATIIYHFDGSLVEMFSHGLLGGIGIMLFYWGVTIGFSVLVAKSLSSTIGYDEK